MADQPPVEPTPALLVRPDGSTEMLPYSPVLEDGCLGQHYPDTNPACSENS